MQVQAPLEHATTTRPPWAVPLQPASVAAEETSQTWTGVGTEVMFSSTWQLQLSSRPLHCSCDEIDNDCDGLVDEPFTNKGTNTTYFLKPAVTKVASNLWVYQYEASRPDATTTTPGNGNGYTCNTSPCPGSTPVAPAGVTLDKTVACSVPNKVPWFNVTPIEVEQTCYALGGTVCSTATWQTACQATIPCTWGYAPRGASCTSSYTGSKYCNLGPSFDFNTSVAGDQDGLLPTASPALLNCWADWNGLQGNLAAYNNIRDITGNLREITKSAANVYPLMGGAFNTATENGATCGFSFYSVDQNFKLFDTGFRCCFSVDPTI